MVRNGVAFNYPSLQAMMTITSSLSVSAIFFPGEGRNLDVHFFFFSLFLFYIFLASAHNIYIFLDFSRRSKVRH